MPGRAATRAPRWPLVGRGAACLCVVAAATTAQADEVAPPQLDWPVLPRTCGRAAFVIQGLVHEILSASKPCGCRFVGEHLVGGFVELSSIVPSAPDWGVALGASAMAVNGAMAFGYDRAYCLETFGEYRCGLGQRPLVPQAIWARVQWGRCSSAVCVGVGGDLYARAAVDANATPTIATLQGPAAWMLQHNAASYPAGSLVVAASNGAGDPNPLWPRWVPVPQVHLGLAWRPRPGASLELVVRPLMPASPYAVRWQWNPWSRLWTGVVLDASGWVPATPTVSVGWRFGTVWAAAFVSPAFYPRRDYPSAGGALTAGLSLAVDGPAGGAGTVVEDPAAPP